MSTLLAIDPGKNQVGWALFGSGKLVDCGLTATEENIFLFTKYMACRFGVCSQLIVEEPQMYQTKRDNGDDLIQLAKVVGACCTLCPSCETVKPNRWKGQVPKDIHNRRTLDKLSSAEYSIYEHAADVLAAGKRHNVIDAIGLGLWKLDR